MLLFEHEVQWRIVSIYVQPLEGIVGDQKDSKRLMDLALHEAGSVPDTAHGSLNTEPRVSPKHYQTPFRISKEELWVPESGIY